MKIPQNQFLHSQSFNSEFIEFVWKFTVDKLNKKTQFPFDSKLVTILIVCNIDKIGNVIVEPWLHDEFDNVDMYITNEIGINDFILDEELSILKNDVVKYLNEP